MANHFLISPIIKKNQTMGIELWPTSHTMQLACLIYGITLLALVGQKHLTDFSRLMWNLHCPYCITRVLTPLHLQEMNPFTVFFQHLSNLLVAGIPWPLIKIHFTWWFTENAMFHHCSMFIHPMFQATQGANPYTSGTIQCHIAHSAPPFCRQSHDVPVHPSADWSAVTLDPPRPRSASRNRSAPPGRGGGKTMFSPEKKLGIHQQLDGNCEVVDGRWW